MAQFEKIETTIYVVFVPIRVLSEFLQTKQFIIPKGDSFARRHFQFNCSLSLSLSLSMTKSKSFFASELSSAFPPTTGSVQFKRNS